MEIMNKNSLVRRDVFTLIKYMKRGVIVCLMHKWFRDENSFSAKLVNDLVLLTRKIL